MEENKMTNTIIRLSEKVNGGMHHFYRYQISDRKMLEIWVNKGSRRIDRIIGYDKIGVNDVAHLNEVTEDVPVYIDSILAKGYEIAEALDVNRLLTFAEAIDIARS
jgi:hypothetical protein